MKPVPGSAVATDRLRRAVEVALPVARERGRLMVQIRAALERGDEQRALQLLRQYCGIPQHSEA